MTSGVMYNNDSHNNESPFPSQYYIIYTPPVIIYSYSAMNICLVLSVASDDDAVQAGQ